MHCISDIDIKPGTRVFVRGDLDVSIENGTIPETFRLVKILPTLNLLKSKGAKIVIAGHIGRPGGVADSKLSTNHLRSFFDVNLGKDSYELLENLRFDAREEANDASFAKELASQADIYVNECFSTCTRKHASIYGLAKILPSYAGLRLKGEVENLGRVLNNPDKPVVIIIGGVKIESKLPVINFFKNSADYILLGGKIGNAYFSRTTSNVFVPSDYVDGDLDIGAKTILKYVEIVKKAKTIVWAGPMGKFEDPKYINGTRDIAFAIISATKTNNAFSVAGGGNTISAIDHLGIINKFSFISTGGSAMLQFLAGEKLPGLEVLGYYD